MLGFSLIEVVAVMALLLLIMGLGLWGIGGSRERQLREKVVLDLTRIDSAKATWRADHPQAVFPADEAARLVSLGAAGILTRDEVTAEGRPLDAERWAGAVDAVGGATLPYVLRTLRTGAAVAASGNAGGVKLDTTVFPFILRGVALLGMDSVNVPIARRRQLWDRLATDLRPRDLGRHVAEVTLDTLDGALDGIVAGAARGRWIVRIGE